MEQYRQTPIKQASVLLGSTDKSTISESLGRVRTCGQRHDEATDVLYGCQVFKLSAEDHKMTSTKDLTLKMMPWNQDRRLCGFNMTGSFFASVNYHFPRCVEKYGNPRGNQLEFGGLSNFAYCSCQLPLSTLC